MPLVRIDLPVGQSVEYKKAVADGVHQAMIEAIQIPSGDRFQVISEHPAGELIVDPSYLDIQRSANSILIQITLSPGRRPIQKRALFAQIAKNLSAAAGVNPSDVVINLVETAWENWSFGNGVAQYMDR